MTEEPGVQQSTELQKVRHDLVTEQQQKKTSRARMQMNKRLKVTKCMLE